MDVLPHGRDVAGQLLSRFQKIRPFHGNYGGSWGWHQNKDFESFNGAIVLTTNCLIPKKKDNTYLDRLFTTGRGLTIRETKHIANRAAGGAKDFFCCLWSGLKQCAPPQEIESGKIVGGFAHHQVLALADKVIDAVIREPSSALWSWRMRRSPEGAQLLYREWLRTFPRIR